ncbi:MAG: hypothetical protein ACE5JO_09010, partial [Candidatus Binatia bacterium]
GNPVRFIASDSGATGIVSRLSCGSWDRRKDAIVAMMDRDYAFIEGKLQECPVANFLVQPPESIPFNEASEIAPIMAAICKGYDEQETYARLLADQYAPVGSRVQVESLRGSLRVVRLLQVPDPFTPVMAKVSGEEEETFATHDLYEHPTVEPDDEGIEPEYEDIEEEGWKPEYADPEDDDANVRPLAPVGRCETAIPVLEGRWANRMSANEATVMGWADENGTPIALLDAANQDTIRTKAAKELRPGNWIDVCLERAVRDMYSGGLVGFMAQGLGGLIMPVPVEALSISLQNPGLDKLEGRSVQLTVVGHDSLYGYPFVSLLPKAEADMEELLKSGEAEGRVVEIVKDRYNKERINIAIDRDGGVIHSASIPLDVVPKSMTADLAPGEKVTLTVKRRMPNEGSFRVQVQDNLTLSDEEAKELKKNDIEYKDNKILCSKPLTCSSVLSLRDSLPRLYSDIRRLYAESRVLFIQNLETLRLREAFEELYREVCRIRDNASVAQTKATREQVKAFRGRINAKNIGLPLSKTKLNELHRILNEAWKIQQRTQVQDLRNQIADLESRIATSTRPDRIAQFRGWIAEKQRIIREIERSGR